MCVEVHEEEAVLYGTSERCDAGSCDAAREVDFEEDLVGVGKRVAK